MKKTCFLKSLLVAAALCVGSSAWADVVETVVVNCDFNSGETLFTSASRMTVSNDNNVKFATSGSSTNGYSLATYNFSSAIGTDATAVKVEFDYWIPDAVAYYRRFFTVGQTDLRTGFGKWGYVTTGSMFAFGLARNSSANYFSINGASTTAAASATSVLGAWAHAEIYVDHSAKTVNYKIQSMDRATTYYSADDVAFVDGSATYCNQLDFYDCWTDGTSSYLDNLVITKYKDNSKVATTYTVKYQNAGGTDLKDPVVYNTYVGDTYTASASDMATFFSDDTNTKYVYASGNTSTAAVETASSNVITLVFNEYSKVAYTVNAKNGATTLGKLASGDAYTDGSTTVYWNKFKQYDGQWYETTGTYGKTITAAGNTDVAYTPSAIAYFAEAENLTKSRSAAETKSGTGYSGGYSPRHYASSQWWTDAFVEGGTFTLTFPYTMANKSESTITIETRDAEGNFTSTGLSLTTSSAGTFSEEVTIPAGSSLAFVKGEYNSNILIDYITLTPTPLEGTIATSGYSSLASKYALDFENATVSTGTLTAYVVTNITKDAVTLTSVDELPANQGVILKGTANATYSIPVKATAEAPATNYLQAAVTATAIAANEAYILKDGQFHLVTDVSTVPAGKAYLLATDVPATARSLDFVIAGEETTGINTVAREIQNGEFYNIQGQRVAAPAKGLYIVNGKKVIVK